jgi:hypothetical protein
MKAQQVHGLDCQNTNLDVTQLNTTRHQKASATYLQAVSSPSSSEQHEALEFLPPATEINTTKIQV